MKRAWWIYLVPAGLLLAVTLPHLGQGDFRTDTARYAAVGLQAWRDPALFWTPHLQPSVPYFNKPPLALWIHGFFLHLFGIGLVSARLPSVLAAAGSVLFTVAIARRLLGRSVALVAGVILALTYEFFRRIREISLDMWQLCFMLMALWLVVSAAHRRLPRLGVLAGLPLGLALMSKPLMALLLVPIVGVWGRISKEGAASSAPREGGAKGARPHAPLHCDAGGSRLGGLLPTIAFALLVALPWHLSMWLLHGHDFVSQYVGREVVERAMGRLNREPPWYYAVEMGRTYWPWMLLTFAGIWHALRRPLPARHRSALALAGIWLVVWGAALTLFPDKRPRYELPLYPALAIVGGYGGARLPWKALRRWRRRGLPATVAIVAAAGLAAAWLPLRVQAPPDPHRSALASWALGTAASSVYSAAFSTNDEGYYYLKTGGWPHPPANPPQGAHLIYTMGLDPKPGANEAVVFRSGPYLVTRLRAGGWQPCRRGSP